MNTIAGLGILALVVYLPVACVITLGLLALWNKLRPPTLWQVLAVTTLFGFLPWLLVGLAHDHIAFGIGYRIWLHFGSSVLLFVPILVPAVLWAMQRRGGNAKLSRIAASSGSLLVGYVVFVVLVLPAALVVGALVFGRGS
jgi:hypothetical protein